MIKVLVFCNGDNIRNVEWITELCCRPMIGDWITSKDKKHSRKIIRIEHRESNSHGHISYLGIELQPAQGDIAK